MSRNIRAFLLLTMVGCGSESQSTVPTRAGNSIRSLDEELKSAAGGSASESVDARAGCTTALQPWVDCVEPTSNGNLKAYFGYLNANSRAAVRAVGTSNAFAPKPTNRGQPTTFQPGEHHNAFSVVFPKQGMLSWTLDGASVAASASSPLCGPTAGHGGGGSGGVGVSGSGGVGMSGGAGAGGTQGQLYSEVEHVTPPTGVAQLIHAPEYHRLIIRNAGSAVAVLALDHGTSALHTSNTRFTDISLSPDQRYLYAADYGGENIGYGTPSGQSYVHRLDLADGSWQVKTAVIAGNVEATSSDTFVLKSLDQWVTFTNNRWGDGDAITQLNTNSNAAFPGYYPGVYSGDFRYEVRSGRLIHGNTGISSQELAAFKIVNGEFVGQEGSGVYGSAQGYGSTLALATDGSALYYGSLSVDVLDVSHSLHVFPESIYAATGDVAFGARDYYDSHTAARLGALDFSTTVYGPNPNGSDFWAFDAGANLLRHLVPSM